MSHALGLFIAPEEHSDQELAGAITEFQRMRSLEFGETP